MTTLAMFSTIIVALITAVIGPVVLEWTRKKLNSTPSKTNPVDEAIELNTLVDEQLQNMMDELQADRMWVAQFHNGGHFYPTGKSIQKFSIFYEKVTLGTAPIQHTFQNVPVSLFPKGLAELYRKGELAIPNHQSEDYGLLPQMVAFGSASFYMIGLEDLHDRFIGALAISFNEEYKLTKEDWIFIRQKAGVIGTLLDEYLNAKK
jgi:hypothetical protein